MSLDCQYELVLDIIRRLDLEIAFVPPLQESYDNLKSAFEHEKKACFSPKLVETVQLKEQDTWRLHVMAGLRYVIVMRTKSPDLDDMSAAKLLNTEIMNTYKSPYRMGMNDRTGYIAHLLKDFQKPKYQQAIIRLSLQPMLDELTDINQDFRAKYNIKAAKQQAQVETGSATKARKITTAALRKLLENMEILYGANELVAKDPDTREHLLKMAFIINGLISAAKKSFAHSKANIKSSKKDSFPARAEAKKDKSGQISSDRYVEELRI